MQREKLTNKEDCEEEVTELPSADLENSPDSYYYDDAHGYQDFDPASEDDNEDD